MTINNKLNLYRVLRTIWLQKKIARVDIARQLNLDKSTITKIVSGLQESGIITLLEEGISSPQGGRKPVYLGISNNFGCILGLEIETDCYNYTALNLNGDVLFSGSRSINFADSTLEEMFLKIMKETDSLIVQTGMPLLGIGLGLAGIINPHENRIIQSLPLNIAESCQFRDAYGSQIPVRIENDARCCCWGELILRREERDTNFMYLLGEFRKHNLEDREANEGPAVGMGLVLNGQVHYGDNFSAGELKTVGWQQGNNSQFSVKNEALNKAQSEEDIISLIEGELSANLAMIINTFNITQTIIGGAFQDHSKRLIPCLQKAVEMNWPYKTRSPFQVMGAESGKMAVAMGAACMLMEQLFSLPYTPRDSREISRLSIDSLLK